MHASVLVLPRARTALRAFVCPCAPDVPSLHACTCMHMYVLHVLDVRALPRLSMSVHVHLRTKAHLNVLSSTPNALPRVPSSHPDSRTLPRLFSYIPRLGITLST
ncbi:hypothetical protein CRG98_021472 [Punica granatum]|uniref:Uncharacterized protein n=1 Tax=Punica granatum TaxID=22663 RepID=A0A2I0JPE1_PUNGR|nr:hypothetical protein CRG98_021472 [Punica granatum]